MGAILLILSLSAPPLSPSSHTASPLSSQISRPWPDTLADSSRQGIAYENLGDALRYDRIQGLSLGLGYRLRLSVFGSAGLQGTVRYGLSDERVTGRLSFMREAPGGRLRISGYREISNFDPFAPGRGFGNTLDALFAGHDNGDYSLVHGGSVGFETSVATGLDAGFGVSVQREASVGRVAKSAVNDFLGGTGEFPSNPPVANGTYGGLWVRLDGYGRRRWSVTADLQAGEGRSTGRLYGRIRQGVGGRKGLTLEVKGGLATAPTLPQSLFRLGGVTTVRGFDYGTLRGQAFWSARLDITPFSGRLRPVAFADAGQAARAEDLFSSQALVGAGVGLSLFHGVLRFDLSHPISPDLGGTVRFDIVVQAVR